MLIKTIVNDTIVWNVAFASLSVDPRLGKMLVYAAIFDCVEPVLTVAAALSCKSVFASPLDKRAQAREAHATFDRYNSDHLATVAAYDAWARAKREGGREEAELCHRLFLARNALREIDALREQYRRQLFDLGFAGLAVPSRDAHGAVAAPPPREWNANAGTVELLKCILCAGLYPNIVAITRKVPERPRKHARPQKGHVFHTLRGAVALHPASFLSVRAHANAAERASERARAILEAHPRSRRVARRALHRAVKRDPNAADALSAAQRHQEFCHDWLVYCDKVETSQVFVRDATLVSPYALMLFGGKLRVEHAERTITVDDWATFRAPAEIGTLMKLLRAELDRLLVRMIESPGKKEGGGIVRTVVSLLRTQAP